MNYRYNFNDKKKSNKKKIIFSIVFILIVIMISATFFRNSENKVVNGISSVLSYPVIGVKNAFSNLSIPYPLEFFLVFSSFVA